MIKLFFGNSVAITSTILLSSNVVFMLWGFLNRSTIQKWGLMVLSLIILNGILWYFSNIRDLYYNSIVFATDGSVADGLFSVASVQSIIYWVTSCIIWIAGIVAIFKPQYRYNIFLIIIITATIQISFIEGARIMLYHSAPYKFNYM